MINEMSTYASIYVPLSMPTALLPKYVHLDRNSQWHTSALMSTAVESMTLPSRLRSDIQRRGLLSDLEAALNINGNQRIAQLQCSIVDPEIKTPKSTDAKRNSDHRASSDTSWALIGEDGLEGTNAGLDIDLSCSDTRSSLSFTSRHQASDHTFAQVENLRSEIEVDEEAQGDESAYAHKRRRFAALVVVQK